MNIVQKFEAKELAKYQAQKSVPDFAPGDTVKVNVKVSEGGRERVQAYEGVCIAREGHGVNESFCVRKISYGEGVERVFPLWSTRIESIELVRRGSVRRAKLYYLRDLRGKSARISERTSGVGIEEREELPEGVTKTAMKKAKKAEKDAVGGGVAIAADNGHAGQGKALFGADNMHDALPLIADIEHLNPEFAGVFAQGFDLDAAFLIAYIGQAVGGGGDVVIDYGQRGGELMHRAARHAQALEGLGGGDFMQQMAVDIDQACAVIGLVDHVVIPDFLKQRAGLHS